MTLRQLFNHTSSIRPAVGDRVINRDTRLVGTVIGKAIIQGTVNIPAISVQYDNGHLGLQVAENEFTKIGR